MTILETVFGRAFLSSIAAFALVLSGQLAAQETRIGEDGFEPPPATLDQMSWLVGQWQGEGIAGALAMESWLPPSGGTMVGTFVQEGSDGSIMFTEHMYLMEEEGTLVLRLKHFNADLTGWEEKDDMLTFRLVALEDCAAYFNALTLRCDGASGLVAAVQMKSDKLEPQELTFRFSATSGRAEMVHDTAPRASSCADAYTTLEINECYARMLTRAQDRQAKYIAAAIKRAKEEDRSALVQKITASDMAFAAYRDAECEAVYEDWIEATIRGAMTLGCRIDLTDKRTHTIWRNWLTYQDSSAPVLPEPGPTR